MIAIEPSPSDDSVPGTRPKRRRPRGAPLLLGMLLGLLVTVAALLAVAIATRDRIPPLTQAAFDAAVTRWDAAGLRDYDLDVELSGTRPGQVHVEVRDGQVARMTRDGVEPEQRRTWYVWSVPGMFDTIEQELANSRDPAGTFKSTNVTQMVMWAEFDSRWGYPRQYHRVVLGADFEVQWKVRRFEPLMPEKTPGGVLPPPAASE